jgi:hypothetical protein
MKHKHSEFEAFTSLVDRVLAVPHSVIQERIEEARRLSDQNPRKRGPKKKKRPTSTASSHASSAHKRRAA